MINSKLRKAVLYNFFFFVIAAVGQKKLIAFLSFARTDTCSALHGPIAELQFIKSFQKFSLYLIFYSNSLIFYFYYYFYLNFAS